MSYSRVSTDFQEKKQISVPAQHRENRDYAFRKEWLLVREFQDEGLSGETLQRPGLQEMLALAAAGALPENGAEVVKATAKGKTTLVVTRNASLDVIVVWKLDRLTRPDDDDDMDFLVLRRDLRRCGVRVVSVTEPWVEGAFQVDGSSMDQFMGYLGRGQTKVEKITREARFRLGFQQIAEGQGRQNGPPPYGYDWVDPAGPDGLARPRAEMRKGRSWAPVYPAASWVVYIFERCLAGQSTHDIVRELNDRAAPPPSMSGDGGRRAGAIQHRLGWTHDRVYHILKNRRYAGFISFEGKWLRSDDKPGGHPALITLDTWETAQQLLAGRRTRRIASAEALFAGGLLRCPRCAAQGRDSSLLVITRHARRTLSTGEQKRYRWIAYACYTAHKAAQCRRHGLVPAVTCENFEVGQKTVVLPLLYAYLAKLARALGPADLARLGAEATDKARFARERAEALRPQGEKGSGHESRRAEMEKQLAQLPLMETNFQMQQAQGLMSMEKLREMLDTLRAREAALTEAIAALTADKPEAQASPLVAAYLLHLLQDEQATPLQKRDALNAVFRKLMVGLDRKSLKVWLK